MSALPAGAGPFSACYIGNFGATAVLTRISSQRTEGSIPEIQTPTEYVVSINEYCQSGNQTISFTLTFYTDTGLPFLLSRSLSVDGAINDVPDPTRKYVLLLINSDTTKQSYLFNEIGTEISTAPNYNKDSPTKLAVKFNASNIDLSYDICKFGTPSALGALLGSRSPL